MNRTLQYGENEDVNRVKVERGREDYPSQQEQRFACRVLGSSVPWP